MPIDLDSTFTLIGRVRDGDPAALERLFERHLKPLQRYARGRLPRWARDMSDTDDLVQETLLRTFQKMDNFEPRNVGALQAYLRQAVVNRIRDEIRRKGRQPDAVSMDDDLEAGSVDSPLEAAIGQEAVEDYVRALEQLREDERVAIIARVELGLDYEELAEALGKPTPEAARKALRRALVQLAAAMKRR